MPETLTVNNFRARMEQRLAGLRDDPAPVLESRRRLQAQLDSETPLYGVNTGFGALANQRIQASELEQLQTNLLLSHACGVGPPVPPDITRLMLDLKLHALGIGFSGISLETFNALLALRDAQITPWVPSRGSLGASGDLAPLAHLCLPLIGRGRVWDPAGDDSEPAAAALDRAGLQPIQLQAKDGLALVNGTQLMLAYGLHVLERALRLARNADLAAAMSLEALQGSAKPFDARVQALRPHPGQISAAANVRRLLTGSEILHAHRNCGKVQDPYCLRCVPQVHGASRDAIEHARSVIEIELNSVTDNPLVTDDGAVLSAGNFHGQPLALVLDYLALAVAEFAGIAERRIYLLLGGHDGLPKLLMQDTGINSGFMIPQYTAAALVSENKVLAHPASVDSIPSSLGQEDHVSMGSISALKLLEVLHNAERVLAVELLTAAQALDFRKPLRPGRGVELAHAHTRRHIAHAETDYELGDDLEACNSLLRDGELLNTVEAELGELE